jgi:hypothetical protein
MMILVWGVLGLFFLLLVVFILGWLNAIRASKKRDLILEKMVEAALASVVENETSPSAALVEAASRPASRNFLYWKLVERGRADLFPAEFRTPEKVAESALVGWLMHPNELAAEPSEIELVRKVEVREGDTTGHSFLFRFRSAPGHWAADHGWMAGTVGPYWQDEPEIGAQAHPFSELMAFDKKSEEEHVEFLKAAMNKKGLVVPS